MKVEGESFDMLRKRGNTKRDLVVLMPCGDK